MFIDDDDDDDDNDDDDYELFLRNGWPTKDAKHYFQPELSKVFTIANLRLNANRIWTCTEMVFTGM